MSSVNRIVISGNLTRDPELRTIPSGKSVCKFSIAVNGWKDEVSYIDCEAWEKTGELVATHLGKGSAVAVDGQIKQDRWDADDGSKRSKIFVRAQNVTFLGSKQDREPVGVGASSDDDIAF